MLTEQTEITLSIIILTWNADKLVKRCLDSISSTLKDMTYEVIVIDNASSDDTVNMINTYHHEIHLIRNERNKGLAARNQGLAIASGKYILLLDVDTVVQPNAINTLINYLDCNPDVGLVAAKLIDSSYNLQYTCRRFPTCMSKLLRRIPLKWTNQLLASEEYRNWDHNTKKEVDYVIGACQMIRREAFEKVGYIDDNIFYGPEDVDYCLRMWQKGYKVIYNPDAVIIHDEQRITKKNLFSRISLEHLKGIIYFFIKHKYFFSRQKIYNTIPLIKND